MGCKSKSFLESWRKCEWLSDTCRSTATYQIRCYWPDKLWLYRSKITAACLSLLLFVNTCEQLFLSFFWSRSAGSLLNLHVPPWQIFVSKLMLYQSLYFSFKRAVEYRSIQREKICILRFALEVIVLYINHYNSESVECGVRAERREELERGVQAWKKWKSEWLKSGWEEKRRDDVVEQIGEEDWEEWGVRRGHLRDEMRGRGTRAILIILLCESLCGFNGLSFTAGISSAALRTDNMLALHTCTYSAYVHTVYISLPAGYGSMHPWGSVSSA